MCVFGCSFLHTALHRYPSKCQEIPANLPTLCCFVVPPLWRSNCILRVQGEPAMRITIKGLLIFCSLIAGLIMAEVVAASNQNDSALPAAVGLNN